MTREELIEVMARAMCVAEFYNPDIIDFDGRENWKGYIRTISAALSALEAAGVRLVYPGEAKAQLIDGDERTSVSIFTPYAQQEQTHESD